MCRAAHGIFTKRILKYKLPKYVYFPSLTLVFADSYFQIIYVSCVQPGNISRYKRKTYTYVCVSRERDGQQQLILNELNRTVKLRTGIAGISAINIVFV